MGAALLLLAKENYISYSKPVAKELGVDEAIIFGELCSINSMLNGREWFYFEQTKIINDTCLSKHRVIKALKNLKEYGLVSYEKRGIPAKNYYKLHEEKLLELMEKFRNELQENSGEPSSSLKNEPQEVEPQDNEISSSLNFEPQDGETSSSLKIEPLAVQNLNHRQSKNSTTINNKNTSKNTSKNTNNNIVEIVNYLNDKAGKNFRTNTPETKRLITKLLKAGFTVEDFKTVIDNQVAKWKGNPEWEEYLRPSTLFNSNKFENYLNNRNNKPGGINSNEETSYDLEAYERNFAFDV